MPDNNGIIEINGKRYDERSGMLLDGPVKNVIHVVQEKPVIKTNRRPAANHAKPHAPSASKLLMRQAVEKPVVNRRIRANGALLVTHPALGKAARSDRRLSRIKHIQKSQSISHFPKPSLNTYEVVEAAAPPKTPSDQFISVRRVAPIRPRSAPQTTAELLEVALHSATSHEQTPLPRPKHHFKRRTRIFHRAHAV